MPGIFRRPAAARESGPSSLLFLVLALLAGSIAQAQVCRISVAGLNRARRVMGPVHAECPDPLHSAPFGNYGVTSNFGHKLNGHQFDGWCHDQQMVDNDGFTRNVCRDGWYEWNSCTDNVSFRAPNCTLYNADDCTQQVSTTDVNVLGTQFEDIPVSCPQDTDGDGQLDEGGCSGIHTISHGTNFMSIYELDPVTNDDLIQTLIYPETVVELNCDFWGCLPTGSQWLAPVAYDSPQSPPKILAEMAMAVNSGTFIDSRGVCKATGALQTVSAASFMGPAVAPDSIASAFGRSLSPTTAAATTLPLPTTLAGVRVTAIDGNNRQYPAPLLFVSPQQVNFVMPAVLAAGPVTLKIVGPNGEERASGLVQLESVAPALFAANAGGQGVAAAIAVRVGADGRQQVEPVFDCAGSGQCAPVALDLGLDSDQTIVLLFGTGIRWRGSLEDVRVSVGGEPAEVLYAGPQLEYAGLDQVNVKLPRSLAGRGDVEVVLEVQGKVSNSVTVRVR